MEVKEGQDEFSKKKKVGNYLLGKIIGQGSFAKVRHGLHIIARETVAVKIVPKKAVLLREYVKRSVRREAMLLQKLDHPNIVRMYEVMETENSYYLVLEYAEAGEFIKYLSEKKRLDERESRKFLRQMASAVDHMHVSNITHRDLKLENLLLDKAYNIKIIDFGLSNVFYGDSSLNTQCGSPVYSAPEMFCSRKYGPAVDIWSMGICFYAMLTGKLPFTTEPPNNISLLHTLILRGAQLPGHITDSCANLLARMLAVDVTHRITMEDLLTHNWMFDEHVSYVVVRQPPVAKLYHTVPKSQVVSYMTTVFNFVEDEVYDSVVERKMNAVAATYHLLQRRFEAGIHLVGYSLSVKDVPTKQGLASNCDLVKNEELESAPKADEPPENSSKLKSYAQMLKDCKLGSAQTSRSGSSVLRQKEISFRRYKTRADIMKGPRTKEESGFLPDFVLTYSQNNGALPGSCFNRGADRFEWEQTFVISKKETRPIDATDVAGKRPFVRQPTSHSQSEFNSYTTYDGHVTRNAESTLPVPPTSPVTPALVTNQDFSSGPGRQLPPTPGERLPIDIHGSSKCFYNKPEMSDNFNEQFDKSRAAEESQAGEPMLVLRKQKIQLARFSSSMNERNSNAQSQCGRRKTLTSRESRSYFQEIEQAKVIGQGRKLLDRSRTSSSSKIEDIHTLYGRQVRTAGAHRELPDIRIITQPAHKSAAASRNFRQMDAHGVLHLSDMTRTSLSVFDARVVSPPKYTVEDGVTDVIKVHITSSAKY